MIHRPAPSGIGELRLNLFASEVSSSHHTRTCCRYTSESGRIAPNPPIGTLIFHNNLERTYLSVLCQRFHTSIVGFGGR